MASAPMQRCIDACLACFAACQATLAHCLYLGGKHAEAPHLILMLDCSRVCDSAADLMLRGSSLHARMCGVCAEACQRCAEDCHRVDPEDTMMQRCAEACRACAGECSAMAAST